MYTKSFQLSHLLLKISLTDAMFLITNITSFLKDKSGETVAIGIDSVLRIYMSTIQIGTIDDNGIIEMNSTYYIIPEQIVKTVITYNQDKTESINTIHIKLKKITPEQKTQIEKLHTEETSGPSD